MSVGGEGTVTGSVAAIDAARHPGSGLALWRDHVHMGLWLLLAPVAVYAPKGTVICLALIVLSRPHLGAAVRAVPRHINTPIMHALGVLFLWAFVSLIWAPEPRVGATALAKLGALSLVGMVAIAELNRSTPEDRRGLRVGVTGFAVLLVFLLGVEILVDGKIGALVKGPPPYRGELLFTTNASAILSLFALAMSALMVTIARKPWGALIFPGIALIVVASLPMFASLAALVLGGAAFGAVWFLGRKAIYVSLLLGIVLSVSTPFVAYLGVIQQTEALKVSDIPTSWQHRLLIWEFTAKKSLERPISGHGFDASRVISRDAETKPVFTTSTSWQESVLPLHPHNIGLQLWLELGVVGVILGLVVLIAIARALASFAPDRLLCASLTGVVTVAWTIASISFGAWQSWWIAALWICAIVSALTAKERRDRDGTGKGA